MFVVVVKKQKRYQCWKWGTFEWVNPLAPGVIMARAVDKLKGDTIKFSWFSFLSSLYRFLLNMLAALVTKEDGSWFRLSFFASIDGGHFSKVEGTCIHKRQCINRCIANKPAHQTLGFCSSSCFFFCTAEISFYASWIVCTLSFSPWFAWHQNLVQIPAFSGPPEELGLHFASLPRSLSVPRWPPSGWQLPPSDPGCAPCIRIGVQEDNFVFDHFLQFSEYKNVQLG